jgi:hypothetical protein
MKISKLIKELESIKDTEGDLDVMWHSIYNEGVLNHIEDIVSIETYSVSKWLEISTNYLLMTCDDINDIL